MLRRKRFQFAVGAFFADACLRPSSDHPPHFGQTIVVRPLVRYDVGRSPCNIENQARRTSGLSYACGLLSGRSRSFPRAC